MDQLIQRFECYYPSADQLEEQLRAEPRRTLQLQNNHATAIFYLSNSQNTPEDACYQLKPGCEVGSDHVAPTDPLYMRSSVAGAGVVVVTGF